MVDVRYMSDKIYVEPIEYVCPYCNTRALGTKRRSHCRCLASELPEVGEGGARGGAGVVYIGVLDTFLWPPGVFLVQVEGP